MHFFQPTRPSPSLEPELQPQESIFLKQDNVGLYEGDHKLKHHQAGTCFLTSHRIVYVDHDHPFEHSVDIALKLILGIQTEGGFLRRSPKVTMRLDTYTSPTPPVANDTDGTSCPACTFKNHPDMSQCEICEADLRATTHLSPPTPSLQAMKISDSESDALIRIAFRNGGHPEFSTRLKSALNLKTWEKVEEATGPKKKTRTVGIRAIQEQIEQSTRKVDETLSDSFQDLERLMAKASKMVELAEYISKNMNKEPPQDDSDKAKLRDYLLNLGIASPVTRDAVGSIYYQELAGELAAFLKKFLDTEVMKPLTEIYCVFNRARGVALVSPQDLYKASQKFESLDLPFRLRRFESGLLVIQSTHMDDERSSQRVLAHVKAQGGTLTALRLIQLEDLAIAVAEELLKMTEQKGLICRDESPAGLTFYENMFLKSEQIGFT